MQIETIAECRNSLGESARWHAASGQLLWLDLYEPTFFQWSPASGVQGHALNLEAPLGALVATQDSDLLLLCHRRGLSKLSLSSLALTHWCNPEELRDGITFNDMQLDPNGRLWVGSSDLEETAPRGALWCVDGDGVATLGDAGFAVSNGPAFSPDGRTMYFSDTMNRNVLAYDMDPVTPRLSSRRILFSLAGDEGYPDGLTVDRDGCIWVAHWDGARVSRWSPEGEKITEVAIPSANVTSVAFGSADYATLFVTTARALTSEADQARFPGAGNLFAVHGAGVGLPDPRMRLAPAG